MRGNPQLLSLPVKLTGSTTHSPPPQAVPALNNTLGGRKAEEEHSPLTKAGWARTPHPAPECFSQQSPQPAAWASCPSASPCHRCALPAAPDSWELAFHRSLPSLAELLLCPWAVVSANNHRKRTLSFSFISISDGENRVAGLWSLGPPFHRAQGSRLARGHRWAAAGLRSHPHPHPGLSRVNSQSSWTRGGKGRKEVGRGRQGGSGK